MLLKAIVHRIPAHYVKQYWGPYRYVMESNSAAHTGALCEAILGLIPVRYGKH